MEGFSAALTKLQAVADAERAALRRVVKAQTKARLRFEREKAWVLFFLQAAQGGGRQAAPAVPEVVELIVGHRERVCVKRSTLMLCADSALARRFDAEVWDAAGGGGSDEDDSDDSDGSDEDSGAISIEEEPYCFRKLIDQLRLVAIAEPGDPPPAPIVPKHEVAGFAKLLDYYFKGVESFINTDGEHRHAGTRRRMLGKDVRVTIKAWGGGGGGGLQNWENRNWGGAGGFAQADYLALRGETLTVTVGGPGKQTAGQGGYPNGGYAGMYSYNSGGGGGASFVSTDREDAVGVIVGAGGGGGGSSGQHGSAGGGGGGGTHNGAVGSGGNGAGSSPRQLSTAGQNGNGGGGKGELGTSGAGSDAGGKGGEGNQQGASSNGAGGGGDATQPPGYACGGGGGGAASSKGTVPDTFAATNATNRNAVNTYDEHYSADGSGAGGLPSGGPGTRGRVVVIVTRGQRSEVKIFDEPSGSVELVI